MKRRPIDIKDFARIVHVGDPQISPDGKYLAFSVVRPCLEENKYLREIWIYELPDAKPITVLQSESDTSPRWSLDGDKLLFTSRRGMKENDKGEAIYVYHVGGGEPRLVYRAKHGIVMARWMPDNSTILAILYTPARRIDEDGDYVEIRGLPVWFEGQGFAEQFRSHIFLIDYESGNARQLTRGDYSVVYAAPSPKGDRIAAVVSRDMLNPHVTEIVVHDVDTGEEEVIVKGAYSFSAVEWSYDGRWLLLHGKALSRGLVGHDHVWVVPADGGHLKCLTCMLDRNTDPAVLSDTAWPKGNLHPQWGGDRVVFLLNESCRVNVYRIDVNSGAIEPLVKGEHVVYSFTVTRDGRFVAYARTSYTEPGEIWLYDVESREARKLTRFNEWLLNEVETSTPVNVKVKASDGAEIEGWYLPPLRRGKDRKHPVVLFIHGGPKACNGAAFNYLHQLIAAQGYYVVYCNPRGSDGYSEEFADIRCKYGTRDYQDIMEFLDQFLAKVPDADPERMAVTGKSYGGYMTNWIITQTDRFRAAISENGVSDWRADFGTSDIGYWFDPDQICGTPWSNRENYERASPINYVDRVRTPVLIIHSLDDYRCYIDQSVAFHVALKYHGKESRLVVFREGGHSHGVRAKPRQRMKRYKLILEFLREKLEGVVESGGPNSS